MESSEGGTGRGTKRKKRAATHSRKQRCGGAGEQCEARGGAGLQFSTLQALSAELAVARDAGVMARLDVDQLRQLLAVLGDMMARGIPALLPDMDAVRMGPDS
jgi:hypothetical protein